MQRSHRKDTNHPENSVLRQSAAEFKKVGSGDGQPKVPSLTLARAFLCLSLLICKDGIRTSISSW